LILPPKEEISCEDKFEMFKGEPASQFLVNCPKDCDKDNLNVQVPFKFFDRENEKIVGMFTKDSSICNSAYKFQVVGEDVLITIGYP
jgi:hypothetical protein